MTPAKGRAYLAIARAIAALSKDQSTQVGALVVGPAGDVRAMGYNGAPRGCSADEDARGQVRPEKYFWFEHAERNAVYNAARVGTPLAGCTLVVTHPPCMDCARAVVQAGIAVVIYPAPEASFLARWEDHYTRMRALFDEVGLEVLELE